MRIYTFKGVVRFAQSQWHNRLGFRSITITSKYKILDLEETSENLFKHSRQGSYPDSKRVQSSGFLSQFVSLSFYYTLPEKIEAERISLSNITQPSSYKSNTLAQENKIIYSL